MQRISTRKKVLSFSAAVLFAFPLSASAGLLDSLTALRSGSTTSSTSGTTTTTSTTASTRTVTYTPTNWPQALKGDLYLPSNAGQRPVVLLLHGGAWQRGDKTSMSGTGKTLAGRGYAAFSINYRFAPGSTHPSQLQDMQQALRWLQQHASEYRLDMSRLAVWGYSAGGHLATLLAVQPASDLPAVKVAIAGAPPSDLAAPEARDASSVKIFMGGTYAEIPALYEQASPRRQVRSGMAPVFLYHGTKDTVVPPVQSDNFATTLRAASVPVELVKLQGYDHSTASGATSLYRPQALAFLDRYINVTSDGTVVTPPAAPVETGTTPPPAPLPVDTGDTTDTATSDSSLQRLRDFLSR
ncbi:MAG: nlhH 2 [Moraxellaceae bacterium]|jgi:acetyl esterase/lipase|nr:nlhH 2 [Moraxellaceae bacterium]